MKQKKVIPTKDLLLYIKQLLLDGKSKRFVIGTINVLVEKLIEDGNNT